MLTTKYVSMSKQIMKKGKSMKYLILMILCLLGISFIGYANVKDSYNNESLREALNNLQNHVNTVSGTVRSGDGELLTGVSVYIKGTTKGTLTDENGSYNLAGIQSTDVLVFSFVGMQTKELLVGEKSNISPILIPESMNIEGVVAIGYGTMNKKQVTSSITSVSSKDLPQGVGGASIATALQGKVGGLVITGSDSPNSDNSFQLRGMASVNTAQAPLIVIDGMAGGDIRSIIQEDIESIDVLKDASAGAIYGTRAAGGVILITTKKANAGKLKTSIISELMFKEAFGKPNMLNAAEYIETYGSAKQNYGSSVDWWNEALNDRTISNRHVLTIQGGAEAAKIYATVMYNDDQGVLLGDSREDYSGRINAQLKLLDGWLDLGTHITYRQADRSKNTPDIFKVLNANPTRSVHDSNNVTGWNVWTDGDDYESNAIAEAALTTNGGVDTWFRPDISLKLNLKPIVGLSYKQTFAYENRQWQSNLYRSRNTREELRNGRTGWAELGFDKTELFNSDGYFSYIKEIDKHSVNAVAGYSYFEHNFEKFTASNGNFSNDKVMFWDLEEGTWLKDGLANVSSNKDITTKLMAYFGRANYSYNDRYMAVISVRREGSSKFAENNRWGTFWSASAG